METLGTHEKVANKFYCKICDYRTSRKYNYDKHISTDKHIVATFDNNVETGKVANVVPNICPYCQQKFRSKSGLWKHSKKCISEEETETLHDGEELTDKQIIMMLIKDNSEFKNMMIEQQKYMMDLVKNGTHNTTNNNTNTNCGNNNKTFNLQVFLNETCKDAINMTDFIEQIQVSLTDLETTGTLGYAEGISKVFIKNLNEINYNDRPIHCSDLKRETLYIKDDNKWTKDDQNKTALTKAIKHVANKNIKQISKWQKKYPDFSDPDSKQNDKYMQIVLNSMSGSTKEESDRNYEKIAKNVIKEVVIEK